MGLVCVQYVFVVVIVECQCVVMCMQQCFVYVFYYVYVGGLNYECVVGLFDFYDVFECVFVYFKIGLLFEQFEDCGVMLVYVFVVQYQFVGWCVFLYVFVGWVFELVLVEWCCVLGLVVGVVDGIVFFVDLVV